MLRYTEVFITVANSHEAERPAISATIRTLGPMSDAPNIPGLGIL